LFVKIVVIVSNIASLIGNRRADHAMTEVVPDAGTAAFVFDGTFNLKGGGSDAIPKVGRKLPTIILD
jgi:hypothetical protein